MPRFEPPLPTLTDLTTRLTLRYPRLRCPLRLPLMAGPPTLVVHLAGEPGEGRRLPAVGRGPESVDRARDDRHRRCDGRARRAARATCPTAPSLIRNESREGLVSCAKQAAAEARGEFVVLLGGAAELDPAALGPLVAALADPEVAAAAASLPSRPDSHPVSTHALALRRERRIDPQGDRRGAWLRAGGDMHGARRERPQGGDRRGQRRSRGAAEGLPGPRGPWRLTGGNGRNSHPRRGVRARGQVRSRGADPNRGRRTRSSWSTTEPRRRDSPPRSMQGCGPSKPPTRSS